MLISDSSLVFPQLIFVENAERRYKTKSGGSVREEVEKVSLFKLDWAKFDEELRKDNERMNERKRRNKLPPWPYKRALPNKYEDILPKERFAIDDSYLKEIHFNTRHALREWSRHRPLDTIIREMCLKSAIAHVEIAFKLVHDCLYVPDIKSRSYYPYWYVIESAMIYKFWKHQTGDAWPGVHANFDRTIRVAKGGQDLTKEKFDQFVKDVTAKEEEEEQERAKWREKIRSAEEQ
jgi:hypothetical protein